MTTLSIPDLEILLSKLGLKTPIPRFTAVDVLTRPLDVGRSYFADILNELVESKGDNAYNSITLPPDIYSGDLAAILPKLKHGADPSVLAFQLMQKFPACPLFILPFPEGVHLRILFRPTTLFRFLHPYILSRGDTYGLDSSHGLVNPSEPSLGKKKLLVEFSSPNIASEFQGKHLRSTILGSYIANLHASMGWDVTKINYLGDWGKPIGLLGVGWERFGSEELFAADPAGHLLDVYKQINELFIPEQAASKKARDEHNDSSSSKKAPQDEHKESAEIESQGLFKQRNDYFKRMEDGEEAAITFWKRVRDVNIDSYKALYARLHVSFDEYSGESQVLPSTMREVEDILRAKGLCEESEGALIIDLKKHGARSGGGSGGVAIVRDRAGSSTYLLRDLAAAVERERNWKFDKMIYVVAADQHTVHFARVVRILELMGLKGLAAKLQHVQFSDVSKMKGKLGDGHLLSEVLDQSSVAMRTSLESDPEKAVFLTSADAVNTVAVEPNDHSGTNGHTNGDADTDNADENKQADKEDDKVTEQIGIAALLTQELGAKRSNDHAFDINKMTTFEPGTGPHLLYWHSRLRRTLKDKDVSIDELSLDEYDGLDEERTNVLRLLVQWPDVTAAAYKSLESATIVTFLVNVLGQLECVFEAGVDDTEVLSRADGVLLEATRIVVENGLKLLGIVGAVH